MPEYEIAALVAGAGYAASVVRLWIRVHARSSTARIRSQDRREVVRVLPHGSRVIDEHDQITIEVGQHSKAEQQGGSSVAVGE